MRNKYNKVDLRVPISTQAPWDPYAAHDPVKSKRKGSATHAPWPSAYHDQYGQQNEHFFPAKSTYAPYVFGKDAQKKKKLIPFSVIPDKDMFASMAKDFVSYLAAPFYIPASISNAISTPHGLQSESLWGKIARSLRAAFLKREGIGSKRTVQNRDATETGMTPDKNANLLASVIKNRIIPILSLLGNIKDGSMTLPKGGVTKIDRAKSVDSKDNQLASRLVDFLRWRRHRTPNMVVAPSV